MVFFIKAYQAEYQADVSMDFHPRLEQPPKVKFCQLQSPLSSSDFAIYALSRSSSVQRSFFCGDVIAMTSWAKDVVNLARPLAVCKNGRRRPGESYHVIRGKHDVTGSRREEIFTFISPATEKLEKQDKFEQKDKSYLQNIPESSLVPRLLPYRKTGREPGRSDHVPRDVLCVVLCVVLIIELLPTQSVLSADTAVVNYRSALKDFHHF